MHAHRAGGTGMSPHPLMALLAAAGSGAPRVKGRVRVVDSPMHTNNLFGPLSEIAGKDLELLERNEQGDCLCLFTGRMGTNICDVDHRDIRHLAPPSAEKTKG